MGRGIQLEEGQANINKNKGREITAKGIGKIKILKMTRSRQDRESESNQRNIWNDAQPENKAKWQTHRKRDCNRNRNGNGNRSGKLAEDPRNQGRLKTRSTCDFFCDSLISPVKLNIV